MSELLGAKTPKSLRRWLWGRANRANHLAVPRKDLSVASASELHSVKVVTFETGMRHWI